jgi:hypothetical protein
MTERRVVDTNVGIVANDKIGGVGSRPPECVRACVELLGDIMRYGCVALDLNWEIIGEYKHELRSTGEPGIGDAFLKWILTNYANPNRCHQVEIRATTIPPELKGFDPADHKFIKTAIASGGARIAEATDSEWWFRRADFEEAGIGIDFICPSCIEDASDRKYGRR